LTKQDADARWAQQANCALVASLPFLQKKLDEVQQQANQQQAPAPQTTARRASERLRQSLRCLRPPPSELMRTVAIAHNRQAPWFAAC
jgi:hypothetical protein